MDEQTAEQIAKLAADEASKDEVENVGLAYTSAALTVQRLREAGMFRAAGLSDRLEVGPTNVSSTNPWPSIEQFESDAALVVAAAVLGRTDVTFEAADAEYAERVYARAERIMRKLEA